MPANHPGPPRRPTARDRLDALSRPALIRLNALPAWAAPLITLVLLLVGLFAGGVLGFVCLAAVAAFLGWLLALAWPALEPSGRLLRLAAVALVAIAAALQLR